MEDVPTLLKLPKSEFVEMIIGTSMEHEICPIHGQVSHNSLYLKKSLQKDTYGPGRDSTKRQAISRLDCLWPEIWRSMSRNSIMKEKQNWASERPMIENARKLQVFDFIDPEDKEFADIIKNARKKLEVQTVPAKKGTNPERW